MKRDWLIVVAVALMWTVIVIDEVNKERTKPWRGVVDQWDQEWRFPLVGPDTLMWQLAHRLDTSGYWERMEMFYMFANPDTSKQLINWANPGTNPVEFVTYPGYTGNGSAYISTRYNKEIK